MLCHLDSIKTATLVGDFQSQPLALPLKYQMRCLNAGVFDDIEQQFAGDLGTAGGRSSREEGSALPAARNFHPEVVLGGHEIGQPP